MPTKPKSKTLAAAEKRVIKNEIKTLLRAKTKIDRDTTKEIRRIEREVLKLYKSAARTRTAGVREHIKICRRLAILEGRLLS